MGGTLIRNADIAMYYAKKTGSHNYRFFKPDMAHEGVEIPPNGQDIWHSLDWYEFKTALPAPLDATNTVN